MLVPHDAGLVGGPGMPEAGWLPIPRMLARRGVTDMVRVSDARMSGTADGTVVLHVAPEAARGGPLACIQDDDEIELDVWSGRLEVRVPADELAARPSTSRPALPERGYGRLFALHVLGPETGAGFDFLVPAPLRDRRAESRGVHDIGYHPGDG